MCDCLEMRCFLNYLYYCYIMASKLWRLRRCQQQWDSYVNEYWYVSFPRQHIIYNFNGTCCFFDPIEFNTEASNAENRNKPKKRNKNKKSTGDSKTAKAQKNK